MNITNCENDVNITSGYKHVLFKGVGKKTVYLKLHSCKSVAEQFLFLTCRLIIACCYSLLLINFHMEHDNLLYKLISQRLQQYILNMVKERSPWTRWGHSVICLSCF